jgi:hypothetical protein
LGEGRGLDGEVIGDHAGEGGRGKEGNGNECGEHVIAVESGGGVEERRRTGR